MRQKLKNKSERDRRKKRNEEIREDIKKPNIRYHHATETQFLYLILSFYLSKMQHFRSPLCCCLYLGFSQLLMCLLFSYFFIIVVVALVVTANLLTEECFLCQSKISFFMQQTSELDFWRIQLH